MSPVITISKTNREAAACASAALSNVQRIIVAMHYRDYGVIQENETLEGMVSALHFSLGLMGDGRSQVV